MKPFGLNRLGIRATWPKYLRHHPLPFNKRHGEEGKRRGDASLLGLVATETK